MCSIPGPNEEKPQSRKESQQPSTPLAQAMEVQGRKKHEVTMAKGVNHYLKDGTKHAGNMHKMADGSLHTGVRHTASSKELFHFGGLSKKAQAKARKSFGKK